MPQMYSATTDLSLHYTHMQNMQTIVSKMLTLSKPSKYLHIEVKAMIKDERCKINDKR